MVGNLIDDNGFPEAEAKVRGWAIIQS
jgi:hypothetical protein